MKITVSQIRNSRIKDVLSNMCFNSQPQNTKNIWFAPKTQINISLTSSTGGSRGTNDRKSATKEAQPCQSNSSQWMVGVGRRDVDTNF